MPAIDQVLDPTEQALGKRKSPWPARPRPRLAGACQCCIVREVLGKTDGDLRKARVDGRETVEQSLLARCIAAVRRPAFRKSGEWWLSRHRQALPWLVESGLFRICRKLYGEIGPAFYGLRTMVLTLLLMALLRIKRPEHLKEKDPAAFGRLLGLDRAPEVKTLRRRLTRLAWVR